MFLAIPKASRRIAAIPKGIRGPCRSASPGLHGVFWATRRKKRDDAFPRGLSGPPPAFAWPLESLWGPRGSRRRPRNLRFLASSHDSKASPRSAPSGLLRLSRDAHKIPAFPARTPQTLRNATSPQGTQRGGTPHYPHSLCMSLGTCAPCLYFFRRGRALELKRPAGSPEAPERETAFTCGRR